VIYLTGVTDPEILEKAMGTSPMGYILKPFRDEDIKNQLRIAFQQKRAQDELKKQLKEQAAGSIVAGRPSGEILFIRDNKQIHRIALPEIAYLEAMDNYTLLYTVKGEKYILNGFLKDCIGRIPFPGILRIHRSYAVVRAHISSVEDNLVSVGERLLPVSKSYRESFYEALGAI
jgi:DNA-binding LytR/AlgR family response regulator